MPRAAAAVTSSPNSSNVPRSGWTLRVAAFRGADGPGAARVPRRRVRRAVPTLAAGPPDRMDGRQVEDVESHVRHVRQLGPHVGEGAVAVRVGGGRTREHLVPGAETGPLPVGHHGVDLRRRGVCRVAEPVHQPPEDVGEHELDERGRAGAAGHLLGDVPVDALHPGPEVGGHQGEQALRGGGRPLRRGIDQLGADQQLERDILTGVGPGAQVAAPCQKSIHLRVDGVPVLAHRRDRELPPPDVVHLRRHGQRRPVRRALGPEEQIAGQHVMPFGECLGLHGNRVADGGLRRPAAIIDLRPQQRDNRTDPVRGQIGSTSPTGRPRQKRSPSALAGRGATRRVAIRRIPSLSSVSYPVARHAQTSASRDGRSAHSPGSVCRWPVHVPNATGVPSRSRELLFGPRQTGEFCVNSTRPGASPRTRGFRAARRAFSGSSRPVRMRPFPSPGGGGL